MVAGREGQAMGDDVQGRAVQGRRMVVAGLVGAAVVGLVSVVVIVAGLTVAGARTVLGQVPATVLQVVYVVACAPLVLTCAGLAVGRQAPAPARRSISDGGQG